MVVKATEENDKRRFNTQQRVALYITSEGHCIRCGKELGAGWHADHKQAWSKGGPTDVINGQALCPTCNLKKGTRNEGMDVKSDWPQDAREWQRAAWEQYLLDRKKDWLLCATPGAGKTKWALNLARYLLDNGSIERVVVVAPTQTIRNQWAEEQTIISLDMVQNEHGGIENLNDKHFEGVVVTYAQVANQPDLQRMGCRKKTLVIFDEIHHAGFPNRSWGEQAKYAFELAERRVGLTGTPWRRPGSGQIPFVTYDEEEGKVQVDFAYEYGKAMRDDVCRVIEFQAYNGEVEYIYLDSCSQQTVIRTLEDEDDNTPVLRTLLKPDGAWIYSMLEKGHQALLNRRRGEDGEGAIADAKGLVIADNQTDARIISRRLEKLVGQGVELIISDEADSEQALDRFKHGEAMWAVAVNKVSEGVDVPPLYVGIYATRKKTPLIFRQIVGRFVRRRTCVDGTPRPEEERPAILFMPAVTSLKELAGEIEGELRQVLDIENEEYERELEQGKFDLETSAKSEIEELPTDISPADLDAVIVNGKTYPQTEYIHAKNLVSQHGFRADQVVQMAELLRALGITSSAPSLPLTTPQENTSKTTPYKLKKTLLREIDRLSKKKAMALHVDYKEFNAALIRRFGPRRELSIEQLKEELQYLDQLNTGMEGEDESA